MGNYNDNVYKSPGKDFITTIDVFDRIKKLISNLKLTQNS